MYQLNQYTSSHILYCHSHLVELAYITNYEDFLLLTTMQYQFAYGIYVGLLNYLGLPQLS